jgi:hypothetical protein
LLASTSLNLALDYLPGSFGFDPAVDLHVGDNLASRIVWFDAYVANVDRSPRNRYLPWWHDALYCIDQGASLYFITTPGLFLKRPRERLLRIAQQQTQ